MINIMSMNNKNKYVYTFLCNLLFRYLWLHTTLGSLLYLQANYNHKSGCAERSFRNLEVEMAQ
jgi:hypothetical protein